MNKVYLLDTNIVSEFSKECPDQNVISLYEQRKDLCAISTVTWQELQYELSKMPDSKRKSYIENWLAYYRECLPVIAYDDFAVGNFWVKVQHKENRFLTATLRLPQPPLPTEWFLLPAMFLILKLQKKNHF